MNGADLNALLSGAEPWQSANPYTALMGAHGQYRQPAWEILSSLARALNTRTNPTGVSYEMEPWMLGRGSGEVRPPTIDPIADALGLLAGGAVQPAMREAATRPVLNEIGAVGEHIPLGERAKLIAQEIESSPVQPGQWDVRTLGPEPVSTQKIGPRVEQFYRWEVQGGRSPDEYEKDLREALQYAKMVLDDPTATEKEKALARNNLRSLPKEISRFQRWVREQVDQQQVQRVFGPEGAMRIYGK